MKCSRKHEYLFGGLWKDLTKEVLSGEGFRLSVSSPSPMKNGFYRKKCFTGKSDGLLNFLFLGWWGWDIIPQVGVSTICHLEVNVLGRQMEQGICRMEESNGGGNWDNCNGTTIKYLIKNTLIWLVFRVLPFTLALCPELENCLVQKESVSISLNKWTSLLVLGFLRDAGSSPVCRHVWALST